jgi:hypothetical protein
MPQHLVGLVSSLRLRGSMTTYCNRPSVAGTSRAALMFPATASALKRGISASSGETIVHSMLTAAARRATSAASPVMKSLMKSGTPSRRFRP